MPLAAANAFRIRVLIIADFSTCTRNCINNIPCNTADLDTLPNIFLKLRRDHYNAVNTSDCASSSGHVTRQVAYKQFLKCRNQSTELHFKQLKRRVKQ